MLELLRLRARELVVLEEGLVGGGNGKVGAAVPNTSDIRHIVNGHVGLASDKRKRANWRH